MSFLILISRASFILLLFLSSFRPFVLIWSEFLPRLPVRSVLVISAHVFPAPLSPGPYKTELPIAHSPCPRKGLLLYALGTRSVSTSDPFSFTSAIMSFVLSFST